MQLEHGQLMVISRIPGHSSYETLSYFYNHSLWILWFSWYISWYNIFKTTVPNSWYFWNMIISKVWLNPCPRDSLGETLRGWFLRPYWCQEDWRYTPLGRLPRSVQKIIRYLIIVQNIQSWYLIEPLHGDDCANHLQHLRGRDGACNSRCRSVTIISTTFTWHVLVIHLEGPW